MLGLLIAVALADKTHAASTVLWRPVIGVEKAIIRSALPKENIRVLDDAVCNEDETARSNPFDCGRRKANPSVVLERGAAQRGGRELCCPWGKGVSGQAGKVWEDRGTLSGWYQDKGAAMLHVSSWRAPEVFHDNVYVWNVRKIPAQFFISPVEERHAFREYVGPQFRARGSALFHKSQENQSNAKQSKSGAEDGSDAHVTSPDRSDLLGFKIGYVVLSLAGGLLFLSNAFRACLRREWSASAFYGYVGALCLGFGLLFGGDLLGARFIDHPNSATERHRGG